MILSKIKAHCGITAILIAAVFMASIAPVTYAEEAVASMTVSELERDATGKVTIDREMALALALGQQQPTESLRDARRELKESVDPVLEAAEGQEQFEKAYKSLRSAYGGSAALPDKYTYTKEEAYNYFYSMRIQAAPLQAEIDKIDLKFNTIEDQMAVNVDLLYSNLMHLIRTESLQKRYMDILEAQSTQNDLQYKAGNLSENDYNALKADASISKLTYEKIVNQRENVELQLKDLLGLSYNEPVLWEDSYATLSEIPLEPVDVYVASALENRTEFAAAQIDADAAEQVYELQVDAYYNVHDVARSRVEAARKAETLEDVRTEIEIEIRSAYDDLQTLYTQFELAKQTYFNSKAAYERGQEQVELGFTVATNLDLLEFAMDSDYSEMSAAYVTYNLAVDRFLKAAEYGPAYTSGGNSAGNSGGNS